MHLNLLVFKAYDWVWCRKISSEKESIARYVINCLSSSTHNMVNIKNGKRLRLPGTSCFDVTQNINLRDGTPCDLSKWETQNSKSCAPWTTLLLNVNFRVTLRSDVTLHRASRHFKHSSCTLFWYVSNTQQFDAAKSPWKKNQLLDL
jgi:hypothetical protein